MTIVIDSIHVIGDEYDENGDLKIHGSQSDGTAIPFFGGVYFTAAHVVEPLDPYHSTYQFEPTSTTIVGQGVATKDPAVPGAYVPFEYPTSGTPNYDKARVVAPADSSQQNAFVFFADDDAASSFLSANSELSFSGRNTPSGQGYFQSVSATGQFDVNGLQLISGDSGGGAWVDAQGVSYVVGLASTGTDPSQGDPFDTFTYLNTGDYYSALNDAASSQTPPSVLLEGYDPNERIRAGAGHASIITNGNSTQVLAGSGPDIVNTGTGTACTLFTAAANNGTDPGTTFVVGAGTTTIVGGNANDKLVLLTDRLWSRTSGSVSASTLSDSSSTIQLLGGYYFSSGWYGPDGIGFHPGVRKADVDDWRLSTFINWDDFSKDTLQGNYAYQVEYNLSQSDGKTELSITVWAPDLDDGSLSWDGSVLIEDFHNGDFGLSLKYLGDADEDVDAQEDSITSPVRSALTGSPQAYNYVDDDPTVSWQGVSAMGADVADGDPAALAALLAATDGTPGTPDPDAAPPPQVVAVADFVANKSALDSSAGGFSVSDTADNVSSVFDSLNADSALETITLSDADYLTLTAAQALGDTTALAKVTNPVFGIAIHDTAAGVSSHFDALTVDDVLESITLTDSGTPHLHVTTQQATQTHAVFDMVTNSGFDIDVFDTAANVVALFQSVVNDAAITSITLTDTGVPAIALSFDQLDDFEGSGTAQKITNQNYAVNLRDSVATFLDHIDQLESDSTVRSVTFTDAGAATLDIRFDQAYSDRDILAKITNPGTSVVATQQQWESLAIGAGQTFAFNGTGSAGGSTSGAGTLSIVGGSTTLTSTASLSVANLAVSGAGTTLTLNPALSYSGAFALSGGAVLDLPTNTVTMFGAVSLTNATITGAYRLYARGTTAINGLTIAGTAWLQTYGTATQSGAGVTVGDNAGNAATLYNYGGMTYSIADDSGIGRGSSTGSKFINNGAFQKTGGTGTSTIAVSISGTGSVAVSSGTLAFAGPANGFAGAISGAGAVSFTSGMSTMNAGTALSVASLSLSGAGTRITTATDLGYAGTLSEGSGSMVSVNSGATFSLSGTTTWAGAINGMGTVAFTGGTATMIAGTALNVAALSLSGTGTRINANASLNGKSALTEGAGTVVNISAGTTWTQSGAATLSGTVSGAGTLAITGGSTTFAAGSSLSATSLSLSGSGATLTVSQTLTSTGSYTQRIGTTINLNGSVLSFTGAATLSGGTVTGSSRLYLRGATALAGVAVGGTAWLETDGTTTQSGGDLTVGDANGNAAYLHNTVTGVYSIADDSDIGRGSSTGSEIRNEGLFAKTGGTGTTVLGPKIVNTGTIEAGHGTLDLAGAVSGAGTLQIDANAAIELGGALAAGSTVNFAGGGASLLLDNASAFAGTVAGFVAGNTIDLRSIGFGGGTSLSYSDTSSGGVSSGTLSVSDGTHAASIGMIGSYLPGHFSIASDGATGTKIAYA